MDIKNVRKWCREFKNAQTDVHDDQPDGRWLRTKRFQKWKGLCLKINW